MTHMDDNSQVSQLEQALLRQAEVLAREHMAHAEAARARILAEADARLKLLTEREILVAKAEAERQVRRRVQATETRLAAELDRLRWALTEATLAAVNLALVDLVRDQGRYLDALAGLLGAAARQLPAGDLVVEANAADLLLLGPGWEGFAARAAPGRKVALAALEGSSQGGLRVRLADNRARLDQTFEARRDRLAEELARVAMEQLFASTPDLGRLMHG